MVLKVAPKRQLNSTNAALPVAGWMWIGAAVLSCLLALSVWRRPAR